jgi:hypothetical protein
VVGWLCHNGFPHSLLDLKYLLPISTSALGPIPQLATKLVTNDC